MLPAALELLDQLKRVGRPDAARAHSLGVVPAPARIEHHDEGQALLAPAFEQLDDLSGHLIVVVAVVVWVEPVDYDTMLPEKLVERVCWCWVVFDV